jgi:hypothetical protein
MSMQGIFWRSPNTPSQADMPQVLGSAAAPFILVGTGDSSLWINVGTVTPLVINGEHFTDSGWTLLAIVYSTVGVYSANPLSGGEVYQTLVDPTRAAVLAKLQGKQENGALQRLANQFYRLLTA